MRFNGEELKFDRKAKCDWCGQKTLVGITHYGTTHYNRLVCEACANKIKEHDKRVFGIEDKEDSYEYNQGINKKVINAEEAIKMINKGKLEGGNDSEGIYFRIEAHEKGSYWGRIWDRGTAVFSNLGKRDTVIKLMIDYLCDQFKDVKIDYVAGIESR